MKLTRAARLSVLAAILLAAFAFVLSRPPLRQDPSYHRMADERTMLGLPNALNVLSNLPFAVVGVFGLVQVFRRGSLLQEERWPYAAVFGGTLLTAFGSSYYHLAPDNTRLVWDRLPMTIAFMGLVAAVLAERVSVRLSRLLFVPLLVLGASSVAYWHWSEVLGAGDLRPYVLVQFGSLLAIVLLIALFPEGGRGTRFLVAALFAYAAAKALEEADRPIFDLIRVVSGHSLKHIAAALSVSCLVAMVIHRNKTATMQVFHDK